mmetsp:Transcript_4506/g.10533  ORF Transcript_4506/g.10533 Transcript_4506/m.10533 type:complete len:240 (+) Transcript_4506:1616-2335(+)
MYRWRSCSSSRVSGNTGASAMEDGGAMPAFTCAAATADCPNSKFGSPFRHNTAVFSRSFNSTSSPLWDLFSPRRAQKTRLPPSLVAKASFRVPKSTTGKEHKEGTEGGKIRLMSSTAWQSSSSSSLSSSMATRIVPACGSSSLPGSTTSSIFGAAALWRNFSASIRSSSSTVLRNLSSLSEDLSSGFGSGMSSPTFLSIARVASPSFSASMVRSNKRRHSLSSGYNTAASSKSNLACDH